MGYKILLLAVFAVFSVIASGGDGYIYSEREVPGAIPLSAEEIYRHHIAQKSEIPVDEFKWSECCDHRDCVPVSARVTRVIDELHLEIKFGKWKPVPVHVNQITESKDGQWWYCRADLSAPPVNENLRCVFRPAQKPLV